MRNATPSEPAGGTLYFDDSIAPGDLAAVLRAMHVPSHVKRFAVVAGSARKPSEDRYLDQARIISMPALYNLFWADQEAATLAPQSAEARYNLGTALARRERYGEAATEFAAAARIKPDFAAAHVSLGAALLAVQDPAQAAAHLRRALALDPRHLETVLNLGQVALARGDAAIGPPGAPDHRG